MFDKLKQINQLRAMQQQIKQQHATGEHMGVKVSMRGDLEIESITLNPEFDIKAQEKAIMKAFSDAKGKIQNMLAQSIGKEMF